MAFKVLIGRSEKGGSTAQQAGLLGRAANDLEDQLNDKSNGVQSVQGLTVHDTNELHLEILAAVMVSDAAPKKKGE